MNILHWHWLAVLIFGLAVVVVVAPLCAVGVILLIRRAERLIYGKHEHSAEELSRRWKGDER
jgi:hypothetical protein